MSLTDKMGTKARICITAAVVAVVALSLFCGKSKTKEAEDAAGKSGDTSSVTVESGAASASSAGYSASKEALNAVIGGNAWKTEKESIWEGNMWDEVRPQSEDWESRKKEIDSIRNKHLSKLKVVYDSLKNDYLKKVSELDLSQATMDDLLMLRSCVYAVNGLLFRDENLYSRFLGKKSPMPWYGDYMCFLNEVAYRKKGKAYVTSEKDIKLSDSEKEFVDRVDGRIAELRKNGMYVNRDGYTVGNIDHIVNMDKVNFDKSYMDKLAQNNFVITDLDTGHLQLFHVYERNNYEAMPSFVTTDLFLQAFHMYLSYALKALEAKKFISALEDLTLGLYNASMEQRKSSDSAIAQIAEYSAVLYAIPYTLLTGKKLSVSAKYQDGYAYEVKMSKDASEDGVISKFLSAGDGDRNNVVMHYSLFKPRGHYTRKPKMEAYFRAMMWLQKAYAYREKPAQLKQNIFTASLLNTAKSPKGKPLLDVYASIFEPTAVLVGEPNNLSVMDIAVFLNKGDIKDLSAALSDEYVKRVDKMLIDLAKRIVIKPKSELSCPDKINFMPQRYVIDAEVLQEMADTSFNAQRAFPKGLDVFYAFGSVPAGDVLNNFYKEKDKWTKYPAEMGKLQKKFNNFDGWNKSVYNKWIEALLMLQKSDKSYPVFMNTKAWDYKNLNTSLASWAELKHDFILYTEQPMAAEAGECGEYLPKPDVEVGYVEPNILFWNKLDELMKLTDSTLVKHNLLDADLKGKSGELRKIIDFLIDASKKELAKQPLSDKDYQTIKGIGGAVENFTITVLDPDLDVTGLLRVREDDKWRSVKGPDRSIAVVADVYTRNKQGDPKNGILHVATGKANEIYVVVEINGYLYVTRGATFSYYEFVMPSGTRLTDNEWQKMEDKKSTRPAVQEWMKTITVDKKPIPNVIGGWKDDRGYFCPNDDC
jgi:hypothetical protein